MKKVFSKAMTATYDNVADRCGELVQIYFTAIPSERVVVASVADSFVNNREVLDRNPSNGCRVDLASLEELTFLDLKMNDSVLLEEANSRDDPEKKSKFN
jgi:hypothetical protein